MPLSESLVSQSQLSRRQLLLKGIFKNRIFYLFVLPGFFLILLFSYFPIYFVQIAFKSYRVTKSLSEAPWVGFTWFERLFSTPQFLRAFRNTLVISGMKLIFGFPAPIILALLLNEIKSEGTKRTFQNLLYLPHFISWPVIGGIMISLFRSIGPVPALMQRIGLEPIYFITDPRYFRSLLIASDIWKGAGWGTIIYLAAISRINPELYEAATADGAGRFRQVWHITLPGMVEIIGILLILSLSSLLTSNFLQIVVLYNENVYSVADTLATYIYRMGIGQRQYSFAAAAGIFHSLAGTFLLIVANYGARWFGLRGLF